MMSACVHESPAVETPKQMVKSNQKIYEYEDSYILFALRAEQLRDYVSASAIFSILYDNTGKKEYLYRFLQNDLMLGAHEKVIKRVEDLKAVGISDIILKRVHIVALVGNGRLEEAKPLALELLKESHEANDALLVSDVYVKLQEYEIAIKYLESAYIKEYDEKILDMLAVILYANMNRKNEAVSQLESHSRIHGCSRLICLRLASFYGDTNNIDGLLSIYLRLYEIEKEQELAKKIVQIYIYKQDSIGLISFLESSKSDDDTLLQLYLSMKNYEKAAPIADKLYEKTGDVTFLGRSAIYEYEGSIDKNNVLMLARVVKKLKRVLIQNNDALYLNYLGYILIDHDMNVKEGMAYIKLALLQEPESLYYLDSLAWGHYKIGECAEADKIMQRVLKLEGSDNEEVFKHVSAIQKCLKKKKVVKK